MAGYFVMLKILMIAGLGIMAVAVIGFLIYMNNVLGKKQRIESNRLRREFAESKEKLAKSTLAKDGNGTLTVGKLKKVDVISRMGK